MPIAPWKLTVCSSEPLLVQVIELPAFTRTFDGVYEYSPAVPPMPTAFASTTVPAGPATTVGGGLGPVGQGWSGPFSLKAHRPSPRAMAWVEPPVAMATYCSPSTWYVMTGASAGMPVWKRHSSLPLVASRAITLPSGSPWKTSPLAVVIEP